MSKRSKSKLFVSSTLVAGCLALSALANSANADTLTLDWTLSNQLGSGNGTLMATTGPSGDLITSMTGSFNGNAITLLPAATSTDNLLFPAGTDFPGGVSSFNPTGVSSVDLDLKGIDLQTSVGTYHFFGAGLPFSEPGEVTGNDIFATGPGGFGVGTMNLQPPFPSLPLGL